MPKISEMQKPALPITGLEMVPGLQGGGLDANVGVPLFSLGGLPTGNVLALRAGMAADLSATADADPGAGKVRWNNASPGSSTVLYVNDSDLDAGSLTSVWSALTVGGFVYVQARETSDRRDTWQKWQVTSINDATGYAKIGVSLQGSNGTFVGDEEIEFSVQQPTPSPGVDRNVVSVLTSSSGAVTVDCSLGDYFTLTLTENITSWSFVNVPAGASVMLQITQGATPRTVAWPGSFTWPGGSDGAVSSVASAIDLLAISSFNAGGAWRATLAKAFAT